MPEMTKAPLKNTSSGHAILSALRTSISGGRWPPGTPLRQAELAEEFGVSRIPVREALQTLQSEGLVRIEPNRGTFVSGFDKEQIDEIFDLRVMLEVDVLRRAVAKHDERSVRNLEAIQRELDHARDKSEWLRLDRAFHDALYAPSEREATLKVIAALRTSVERFYISLLHPEARRGGWNDEHQQLIAAVRNKKSKLACELLTQHLRQTHQLTIAAANHLDTTKE